MPKNTYFTQGTVTEQNLYEELVIEAMGIYGSDVYYMPRHIVSSDRITNEVIESKFEESHLIEMYLESTEGFEGDGTLLSKFGLEIRDQVNLVVAKRTFLSTMQESQEDRIRPLEGDLIYLPTSKSLFEIKFVEHEQPFYQLNNLPIYKLNCELYEYQGEDIDTGIGQVDAVQSIHAESTSIEVELTSGSFLLGEDLTFTFTDGSTADAELLSWITDVSPYVFNIGTLTFTSDTRDIPKLTANVTFVGKNSGATGKIVGREDLTSNKYDNDKFDDSADFELNNNFIDFSEFNPFGEPNA